MTSTKIDGHAHFHPIFSLSAYLRGAEENFGQGMEENEPIRGVLLLGKTDLDSPLSVIETAAPTAKAWRFSRLDSTTCLFEKDSSLILVVAGRQIVTQEKLELLALCCAEPLEHGLPLRDSISQALAVRAVPVIPWGFGKWWFSRGRVVRSLPGSDFKGRYLLGDSGCRLAARKPSLISEAKQLGVATLAGSDPLPIRSHVGRAGSFGTVVPEVIDLSAPTDWIRRTLMDLKSSETFGRGRSLYEFVSDQIGVRVAKNR